MYWSTFFVNILASLQRNVAPFARSRLNSTSWPLYFMPILTSGRREPFRHQNWGSTPGQSVKTRAGFIPSNQWTHWWTWRSPAIRQPPVSSKCPFFIQVSKYRPDLYWVFDANLFFRWELAMDLLDPFGGVWHAHIETTLLQFKNSRSVS